MKILKYAMVIVTISILTLGVSGCKEKGAAENYLKMAEEASDTAVTRLPIFVHLPVSSVNLSMLLSVEHTASLPPKT